MKRLAYALTLLLHALAIGVLILFSLAASAMDDGAETGEAAVSELVIGDEIDELIPTSRGKGVVLVFLGTECVISRRMIARLNELAVTGEKLGFKLYGLFPNQWDTSDSLEAFAADYEVEFPLILDDDARIARKLKPSVSPEVFLFDDEMRLMYRGRIDNRFAAIGVLRNKITRHDLLDAMQAISEGALPEVTYSEPVGCVYGDWDEKAPSHQHNHKHG